MYYFVPIVLYAVVGTFLSSVVVGLALFGLSQVKKNGSAPPPPVQLTARMSFRLGARACEATL